MKREKMLGRVRGHKGPRDIMIVGGGATGAGVAVDAASRGYDVLLLEREDFGKATSSRSTKLVHGGVRSRARQGSGMGGYRSSKIYRARCTVQVGKERDRNCGHWN